MGRRGLSELTSISSKGNLETSPNGPSQYF